MDLAVVKFDVQLVGAHGQLLEEELIVGPVVPVLDDFLEVLVEYPVVLGPLDILLEGRLGGVRLWLTLDAVGGWVAHRSVMASSFSILNGKS